MLVAVDDFLDDVAGGENGEGDGWTSSRNARSHSLVRQSQASFKFNRWQTE